MSDMRFAAAPSYASHPNFHTSVSDDGQEFTVTLHTVKITIEPGGTIRLPVASHVFSMVWPVEGPDSVVGFSRNADGYAEVYDGASGYAVLSGNGKTSVNHCPPGTRQDFDQALELEAGRASECRVTIFLLVERDSAERAASAHLRIRSLHGRIRPALRTYTVVKGDSLSKIAAKLNFPGGWEALYRLNREVIGPDPNVIKPGQVLQLG
jgi:nucleoid-associated protein YgaU